MEINLDCSDIINNEVSEFLDNNSQICLNQEEMAEEEEIEGCNNNGHKLTQDQNQQPMNIEQVHIAFRDDFEEIKQEDPGMSRNDIEDGFFMKDFSPIRADKEDEFKEAAPKSIDTIRALGTTNNPQIKKLLSYQVGNSSNSNNEDDGFSGKFESVKNVTNSRQWAKQPEIKAKIIGTQMMKPPVPTLAIHSLSKDQKSETTNFKNHNNNQGLMTLDSNQDLSSTGNVPTQLLGSTATSTIPLNKQWQKVQIAKRRPTTAAQQAHQAGATGQRSTSTSSIITKTKMPINISNLQNSDMEDAHHPRTYRETIISSPNIKQSEHQAANNTCKNKRRKAQPDEIVPVFDCLFCCQEHFVMAKLSENNMMRKYANNKKSKNIFLINLYQTQKLKIDLHEEVSVKNEPTIKLVEHSLTFFRQINTSHQFQTPLHSKYVNMTKQKLMKPLPSVQVSLVPKLKLPITPVEREPKNVLNMAELEQSAIYLEDGTELLGARHGMKTRRQRIMEQISFETDSHNIYDPFYTSEEDNQSRSLIKLPDGCDLSQLPPLTTRRKQQPHYEPSSSSMNSLGSNYISSQSDLEDNQLGDESFSSIEKQPDNSVEQIDTVFGNSSSVLKLEPVSKSENKVTDSSIVVKQHQFFMQTGILNIQENKFTPDQEDKESQRYTFGCITPKGINMIGTGALAQHINAFNPKVFEISAAEATQELNNQAMRLRENEINEVEVIPYNEPLLNSDQSPISHLMEEQKTIQEFSPVVLTANINGNRRMTENPLYSDDQDSLSKINFHPPSQLLESLEEGSNFTRLQVQAIQRLDSVDNDSCDDMSLKMAHQAMVQNFMNSGESQPRIMHSKTSNHLGQPDGNFPDQNSRKEVCFSPIRHENSISRDDIQAVVAVQEAIQGQCFNNREYYERESSIPNYNRGESLQQISNQLFGNKDIMMTSKFQDKFRISSDPTMFNPMENFSGSLEKIDQSLIQPLTTLEPQTINLGYIPPPTASLQNHSFSAFNTKHLLNNNSNNHLTPQVVHQQQRLILDPNSNHLLMPDTYKNNNHPSMSATHQKLRFISECEGGDTASRGTRKKSGKKYLIKQEQLSQLMQMVMEKKNAANNLTVQDNNQGTAIQGITSSINGLSQMQFFDSIVKQNQDIEIQSKSNQISVSMNEQRQQAVQIQNFNDSNNSQSSKKKIKSLQKHHKKQQKTQDFNKNASDGPLKSNQNALVTLGISGSNNLSQQNLHEKRAPKIPTTTIEQNNRKMLPNNHHILEHLAYSSKCLNEDQVPPSRQPNISSGANRAGKNYHISLNNAISNSKVGSNKVLEVNQDPQQDRPLTLRHHYQLQDNEDSHPINIQQIEVSPNLLIKAAKNFQKPINNAMIANQFKNQQQLTKEELAIFLRSAICSSRYSSSSATGGHVPSFAGHAPSNNMNFNLLKQMSIDTTVPLQNTTAKQRLSSSNFKQNSCGNLDDKQQTLSPKQKRRKPHHFKQEPLLTEGADFSAAGDNTTLIPHHHHQLSIDNQTTIHKSSGKINDRRDSSIRGMPGNPTATIGTGLKRNNQCHNFIMRKVNPVQQLKGNVCGSLEKVPSKKFIQERAASGKQQQRVNKMQRVKEVAVTGSKERSSQGQRFKKNKSETNNNNKATHTQKKQFQQKYWPDKHQNDQQKNIELQAYMNLCNSINFSNEISVANNQGMQKNQQSSQSNLNPQAKHLAKNQQTISTSMINENTYMTKNLYNSNALLPHNSSSIIPNQNHHYYHHHNTNSNVNQITVGTIDTSQNIFFGANNPLITSGAGHTSGAQCEMSTTISNNQLSLTRLASGAVRGLSNGKGNQTISSSGGGQNNSQATNQTTLIGQSNKASKVVIPQLQLNKIKNNSSKRVNQLNGSQDEIQLQSLLLNLNQHLQSNPYQTRVSLLKEGSNTVSGTPNGGPNTTTSFQKCIIAAAATAQSQAINTKRSQASSLSQQRHHQIEGKSCLRNQDVMNTDKSNERLQVIKQIDYSVQNQKKKQDAILVPPLNLAIATAIQPDRRQKSKDQVQIPISVKHAIDHSPPHPDQLSSITKKLLQNSFTLKQLKLMNMNKVNLLTQQQLTGRLQQPQIDTQRPTERAVSNNNRGTINQDNATIGGGGGTCRTQPVNQGESKEKSSQKRMTKLLIKNQKHIIQNTRVGNELQATQQLNRSSLNLHKDTGIPVTKFQSRPSFPITKKKAEVGDMRIQNNLTLNLSSIAQSNLQLQKQQPPTDLLSMNRFYDTGRQTLISQVASPHKNLVPTTTHVSHTQVPTQNAVTAINTKVQNTKGMTTALGSKNSIASNTNASLKLHQNQFSLKSIFSKNPPTVLKGSKKQINEMQSNVQQSQLHLREYLQ